MTVLEISEVESVGSNAVSGAGYPLEEPRPFDVIPQSIKVTRGAAILLVGQLVVQVSMILVGVLVARSFGQTGYGQYSLAFAFVGIFGLLFSLGADSIVVREVAQAPLLLGKILNPATRLRLASFPVALFAVWLGAWILGYGTDMQRLILFAAVATGLSVVADLPRSVFRGLQRMHLDTVTRAGEKVGVLVLVVGFLQVSHNLDAIMVATVAGSGLGLGLSWLIITRVPKDRVSPERGSSLRLLKASVPLGASYALIALYTRMPLIVLSGLRSYGDVGIFSVAYSATAPLTLLPVAFVGALLPTLANLFKSSRASLNQAHQLILVCLLAVSLPLSVELGLLGGEVVQLVYGEPFKAAGQALAILSLSVPVVFLTTYLTNLLIVAHAQSLVLLQTILSLAVTTGVSLLLIPFLGYQGAAMAVVATEFLGLAVLLFFTSRWVGHKVTRRMAGLFAATLLMAIVLVILEQAPLWLRIPVGGFVYVLGLVIAGGVTLGELKRGARTVLTVSRNSSNRP